MDKLTRVNNKQHNNLHLMSLRVLLALAGRHLCWMLLKECDHVLIYDKSDATGWSDLEHSRYKALVEASCTLVSATFKMEHLKCSFITMIKLQKSRSEYARYHNISWDIWSMVTDQCLYGLLLKSRYYKLCKSPLHSVPTQYILRVQQLRG